MNPELKRLYWRGFSPVSFGVSIALIMACLFAVQYSFFGIFSLFSLYGFISLQFAIIFVYGISCISRALNSDIKNQVWEQQRLSAISAWRLAWGKLLGAGLTCWLLSIMVTLIYLIATPKHSLDILQYYLLFMLVGISAHALVLSLQLWVGGTMSSFVLLVLIIFLFRSLSPVVPSLLNTQELVLWWGYPLPIVNGMLLSALLFMSMSLLVLWRTFRYELLLPGAPWLPIVLALVAWVYYLGFMPKVALGDGVFILGLISLGLFYCTLLGERFSFAQWHRLSTFYKQHKFKRIVLTQPLWMGLLLLGWLCGVLYITVGPMDQLGWLLLIIVLNSSRDLFVILAFNFTEKLRSAFYPLVSLLALYLVGPILLQDYGGAYLNPLLQLMRYDSKVINNYLGILTIIMLQCMVLAGVIYILWIRRVRALEEK